MTSKEFVKETYPKAKSEKHIQGHIKGAQKTYWLIRNGRETMYMAHGDTESKAWKAVKQNILDNKKD